MILNLENIQAMQDLNELKMLRKTLYHHVSQDIIGYLYNMIDACDEQIKKMQ